MTRPDCPAPESVPLWDWLVNLACLVGVCGIVMFGFWMAGAAEVTA